LLQYYFVVPRIVILLRAARKSACDSIAKVITNPISKTVKSICACFGDVTGIKCAQLWQHNCADLISACGRFKNAAKEVDEIAYFSQ